MPSLLKVPLRHAIPKRHYGIAQKKRGHLRDPSRPFPIHVHMTRKCSASGKSQITDLLKILPAFFRSFGLPGMFPEIVFLRFQTG